MVKKMRGGVTEKKNRTGLSHTLIITVSDVSGQHRLGPRVVAWYAKPDVIGYTSGIDGAFTMCSE